MPRPRTLLICAAVVVALMVFVVFGLAGSKPSGARAAPPLPLEHLSGPAVTLAPLRGRPVLVSFWASWCEPCEHEAPVLERFARGLHGKATLVGVNWEDLSLADARKFISTYGWTFPNLRDPDGNVGRDYGMTGGPPETFVIDSAGRLRAELRGPQTQQTLESALASVGA
jgi:cytochrome c biogenesis protein CcmG, thiol:disulfide interchange protein DsbE